MQNILFYKFVKLQDLESLRKLILDKAISLDLRGKILIAEEGVNGCVSGTNERIDQFKLFLSSDSLFGSIEFKHGLTNKHTFKKMFVRIRKEIITFKQDIDVSKAAEYIEPLDLKAALDRGEDIILLDARNDYESKIGRFKNAILPDVHLFSELPEKLRQMPELKDKTIVTYCTGGIRCEKSATWMLQNGFKNVRQLHGGILRYGDECGNTHWVGRCFVFDRRGAIDIDPRVKAEHITQCVQCFLPCSDYHNCAYVLCDKRTILCEDCIKILEQCCSKNCREKVRQHPDRFAPTAHEKAMQVCSLH